MLYEVITYISIVFDPVTVKKLQEKGETVIYGDAENEPILEKAHVDTADVVVISVGNLVIAMSIIEKIRALNPRITSYNVCYTKLLRMAKWSMHCRR